jgi:ribosomal protein S18 acetylase RimI-like enzyme
MLRPWLILRHDIRSTISRRWQGRSDQSFVRSTHLVAIGVDVSVRGGGVGTRLLEAFEEEASQRGAERLALSVYRSNLPAQRLYKKAGWSRLEDAGDEHITMTYQKQLPSRRSSH